MASNDKQLNQLLAEAISTIPTDKQQEILNHPDTPTALEKLKAALGLGTQDAMSPAEQVEAKKAGIPTYQHPEYGTEPQSVDSTISEEDRIRNQQISDMAEAATKPAETKTSKPKEDMLDGLVRMATHGMKTYVKELSAAIQDSQEIAARHRNSTK